MYIYTLFVYMFMRLNVDFLLYIFTIFTTQYLCDLCNYNVLLIYKFFIVIYLFIRKCISVCYTYYMYNVCWCYIHCLCVMSYLVKRKSWAPIKHV